LRAHGVKTGLLPHSLSFDAPPVGDPTATPRRNRSLSAHYLRGTAVAIAGVPSSGTSDPAPNPRPLVNFHGILD
jgi:hypothetical protein